MALFNEILEGGLNQVIVKRLGMQTGTAVPAVQPEMTMDLTLESDRPEWGWLKGEYRYGGHNLTQTPIAGSHAAVVLANVPGRDVIGVVERIAVSATSIVAVLPAAPGTLITGLTQQRIDSRQPAAGRLPLSEYHVTTANLPTSSDVIFLNTEMYQPFIVAPNSVLAIVCITAAQALRCSVRWRERPVLPGELG